MTLCIRTARRSVGLSRRRFGAAVGVNRSTVTKWEGGTRVPTEERIERIEQFLTNEGINLAEVGA